MALEIRITGSEEYGQYIKALIVGRPGSGKTLTASTWKDPFYVNAEGGLMSIADRKIPYHKLESIAELLEIKNKIEAGTLGIPVGTLVIDTLDEIQKLVIRERLADTGKESLTLPEWGYVADMMRTIVRGLRNLDVNVVFTCHSKDQEEQSTGTVYFKPALQGAFGDEISGMVDLALLLKTETTNKIVGETVEPVTRRFLVTVPDAKHDWIKDRSGKLPRFFDINFEDDYERLHKLIFAGVGELPDSESVRLESEPEKSLDTVAPIADVDEAKTVKVGGKEVAVRNELPKGVKPKPSTYNSGIFCEIDGKELKDEETAKVSKIRFKRILCEDCFEDQRR
jgi:hypothetical protein